MTSESLSRPLTNREFPSPSTEPFSGQSLVLAEYLFGDAPHGSETAHYRSYVRNRLALVNDLCDILEPSGSFSPLSTDILEFIVDGHNPVCRDACCRSDTLPLWYAFLRKKFGARRFTPNMNLFLKLCVHLDWLDWFAEQVRRSVNAPDSKGGRGDNDDDDEAATRIRKRPRTLRPFLGARDFAHHWNTVRQFFGAPALETPEFEFGSLAPVHTTLKVEPNQNDPSLICVALCSGRLPASIEVKFAEAYVRASKIAPPCLFHPARAACKRTRFGTGNSRSRRMAGFSPPPRASICRAAGSMSRRQRRSLP